MKRNFELGDHFFEKPTIHIGRGGGFTDEYIDLSFKLDGSISLLKYIVDAKGKIPNNAVLFQLGVSDPETLAESVDSLLNIDFFNVTSVDQPSSMIAYMVSVSEDGKVNSLEWIPNRHTDYNGEVYRIYQLLKARGLSQLGSLMSA